MACSLALAFAGLQGCGTDLGECDMAALGGSNMPGMLSPHTGQIAVNTSCASGRCHSQSATGENRVGAPAELNFDVVPVDLSDAERVKVTKGATKVQDEKEEMWELIDSGDMPPEGQRAAPSAADKEAIRNWLACGAEVVMAPATSTPTTADLTSIYTSLKNTCSACHSVGPDNNFLSGTQCDMYNALVGKTSMGSVCKSNALPLVVPSNPDGSLFLQKMSSATPPCGSSMPLGAQPLIQIAPGVVQAVREWIMAGAMKPAGCP
jgi:hypothetical protein